MKKAFAFTLALVLSVHAQARSINVDGTNVGIGDHVSTILKGWGSEQYRVSSDKTCHPYNKKQCSYKRLVWKRGETYVMVQHIRSQIINIKRTKKKRDIRKAF